MTEKKLDYVILGLLSHEDLTGYDIKERINSALSMFWSASYGSIYPTLSGLVKEGYAEKRGDDKSPRNRIIYSITPAGRAYLKKWLCDTDNRDELRYETLLKLFFGNEAGDAATAKQIRAFREKAQHCFNKLLEAEKNLSTAPDEDGTHRYYLMTVRFGLRSYWAYMEYCDDLLRDLEGLE